MGSCVSRVDDTESIQHLLERMDDASGCNGSENGRLMRQLRIYRNTNTTNVHQSPHDTSEGLLPYLRLLTEVNSADGNRYLRRHSHTNRCRGSHRCRRGRRQTTPSMRTHHHERHHSTHHRHHNHRRFRETDNSDRRIRDDVRGATSHETIHLRRLINEARVRSFIDFLPCYPYEPRKPATSGIDSVTSHVHSLTDEQPSSISKLATLSEAADKESSIDNECVICMNEFVSGDEIRLLPCMHNFHKECVDNWLRKSFTCPSCAEPVDLCILASLTG